MLAFAGLGFDIGLTGLRAAGVRPLMTAGVYLLAISALTLTVVTTLF